MPHQNPHIRELVPHDSKYLLLLLSLQLLVGRWRLGARVFLPHLLHLLPLQKHHKVPQKHVAEALQKAYHHRSNKAVGRDARYVRLRHQKYRDDQLEVAAKRQHRGRHREVLIHQLAVELKLQPPAVLHLQQAAHLLPVVIQRREVHVLAQFSKRQAEGQRLITERYIPRLCPDQVLVGHVDPTAEVALVWGPQLLGVDVRPLCHQVSGDVPVVAPDPNSGRQNREQNLHVDHAPVRAGPVRVQPVEVHVQLPPQRPEDVVLPVEVPVRAQNHNQRRGDHQHVQHRHRDHDHHVIAPRAHPVFAPRERQVLEHLHRDQGALRGHEEEALHQIVPEQDKRPLAARFCGGDRVPPGREQPEEVVVQRLHQDEGDAHEHHRAEEQRRPLAPRDAVEKKRTAPPCSSSA
mmetsp:Transcript_21889/g.55156  ORF Transcript_21889/g.55156 Transcript_21889/m.55156 type:complete len:405 (-) Transcript_21889:6643-7857(-)